VHQALILPNPNLPSTIIIIHNAGPPKQQNPNRLFPGDQGIKWSAVRIISLFIVEC
jgi:hypothetical protein